MYHSAAWLDAAIRSGALRPHRPPARRPARRSRRLAGDRGEGVISAAIAVLIVAFLGALMWTFFSGTVWETIKGNTCDQMNQIGGDATTQTCTP